MECAETKMPTFVEVLLDQNLSKPLDYSVPSDMLVQEGMRVMVPLKSTLKKGTISKLKSKSPFPQVKPIHKILSIDSELTDAQWKLARWMAKYYCAPLQRVLKSFIPTNIRKAVKAKTQIFLTLKLSHDATIKLIQELRIKTPKQAEVLEVILKTPKGAFLADLNVSKSAVASLVKKKILTSKSVVVSDGELLEEDFFPTQPKLLNQEQKQCLEGIDTSIEKGAFSAHLIYGVTGSGKTEVYMQAIQKALDLNKSAIMLVPEISLTSQTIERFKARFSEKIAVLHHRRSLGERTQAWEDLKRGSSKLVIGARSALFAPIQNLGLIIVDEEHDGSYKQSDEIPCYHGRDTAVMRASIESCTILLGSATPSIESMYNARVGKYHLHTLKSRATSAPMPSIQIVDMLQTFERNGGFTHFSEELLCKLKNRLENGEQTLLFLNKRGYHRMQVCRSCTFAVKCPHCDLALTFHKKAEMLQCHLCDYRRPLPKNCPNCNSSETMQFRGFGTEHVEKALHAVFPEVRTLRMDRDTTAKKNSHEEMFKQFRAHKADVLIGTQMIAKGFHFPSVTLVGILNPDATLNIPDFRAPESVFQLLTQVAGRAGRAELPGEVIIQTFMPDHPILRMAQAQDYDTFYQSQIDERNTFCYPPFCRLIKIQFSEKDPEKAEKKAQDAHLFLSKNIAPPNELMPVMPAGHAKVKDLYRFQFLVKVLKLSQILPLLERLDGGKIDVDPLSTYF